MDDDIEEIINIINDQMQLLIKHIKPPPAVEPAVLTEPVVSEPDIIREEP